MHSAILEFYYTLYSVLCTVLMYNSVRDMPDVGYFNMPMINIEYIDRNSCRGRAALNLLKQWWRIFRTMCQEQLTDFYSKGTEKQTRQSMLHCVAPAAVWRPLLPLRAKTTVWPVAGALPWWRVSTA